MRKTAILLSAACLLQACSTTDKMVDGVKSAGSAVADGVGGVATSLIKVDLSNVLNDLALDLKIDKANVPINAQIPINVAANVCGISINLISIGGGGSKPQGCTANSVSPELVQAIQQQLAANGNVGGGAQTNGAASGTSPTPTAPTTTAPTTNPAPATSPTTQPTPGTAAGTAPTQPSTPQ